MKGEIPLLKDITGHKFRPRTSAKEFNVVEKDKTEKEFDNVTKNKFFNKGNYMIKSISLQWSQN